MFSPNVRPDILAQRSFEQYDAIEFFDFRKFSSDEMAEAIFQWKSIIFS